MNLENLLAAVSTGLCPANSVVGFSHDLTRRVQFQDLSRKINSFRGWSFFKEDGVVQFVDVIYLMACQLHYEMQIIG